MAGVTARITGKAGDVWKDVSIDLSTQAMGIIEYEHHEIHGGSSFFADYSALKGNGETVEVLITVPKVAKEAHMVLSFEAALAATVEIWRPSTKTHNGTNAITPVNRHENVSKESILTLCHTPGGSQAGNASFMGPIYVGSASSGFFSVGGNGGSTGGRHEIILKRNSTYLIRMTSRADGNALHVNMDWYEHTSKANTFTTTTTTTTTTSTTTTTV